jgi:hypothetical protein
MCERQESVCLQVADATVAVDRFGNNKLKIL